MTRLTQALERAAGMPRQNAGDVPAGLLGDDGARGPAPQVWDFNEAVEEAEVPHITVRPLPVAQVATPKREPAPTPRVTSIRCPGCERVQGVRTDVRGFWESTVLSLVRIRPYQCSFCSRRFRRFNGDRAEPVWDRGAVEAFSSFLTPDDTRDFQELIHDIARAEQELRIHGLDGQLAEKRQQTRGLRKSDNWPPVNSVPKRQPGA